MVTYLIECGLEVAAEDAGPVRVAAGGLGELVVQRVDRRVTPHLP
ncbi:hypothetical protein DVS28_b0618 (plasmid) [Euzebya pacifica]|uniref:Uncharacterized protein n=2 Tax=Euzebya pacifica TaxID=1608957 RepID=A0A346Y7B1_9ACTN|nr:hypothetical protein DVS28_b0618 [Euzebya pacifica]